jgi:hypothetical protein
MDEIHYCAMELRIRDEAAKPPRRRRQCTDGIACQDLRQPDSPSHRRSARPVRYCRASIRWWLRINSTYADSAYDLAKYSECMLACICGSTILGGEVMSLLANILFGLGMLAVSLLLITSGLFLTHAYYISPEGAHWIFSFTAPLIHCCRALAWSWSGFYKFEETSNGNNRNISRD